MKTRQALHTTITQFKEREEHQKLIIIGSIIAGTFCAYRSEQSYNQRTEAITLEEEIGKDIQALALTYRMYWTAGTEETKTFLREQYREHMTRIENAEPHTKRSGIDVNGIISKGIGPNMDMDRYHGLIHNERAEYYLQQAREENNKTPEARQKERESELQGKKEVPHIFTLPVITEQEMQKYEQTAQTLEYEVQIKGRQIQHATTWENTIVYASLSLTLIILGIATLYKKKHEKQETQDDNQQTSTRQFKIEIKETKGYTL